MRSFGSAVALGALLVAGAFAACVSSPPTPPPPTVADEASTEAAVPTASATSVPRAEAPAPPTTAEAGAKTAPPPSAATAPLDVARCNHPARFQHATELPKGCDRVREVLQHLMGVHNVERGVGKVERIGITGLE